jgi:catalase
MDDAARDRLIDTVSNILSGLGREEVLRRAFAYWRNIDAGVGNVIETATLERRGDGTFTNPG